MSESKRTMDLGESTLERREFLSVGGATIAATAIGGGEGVDVMDGTCRTRGFRKRWLTWRR